MAWTSRADRFVPLSQNDEVGPGSYGGHAEHTPEPQYVPFGTSSKPRAPAHKEDFKEEVPRCTSPPPGAYDPKLPKAYDSGLPKKHVPFGCGAARVGEQPLGEKEAPGPGAYNVVKSLPEALSCRTMGAPPADRPPMLKSTSAPSIPCSHQSFGYEESGDGRLIRQGPRDKHLIYSGKNGDTVGPGHYGFAGEGIQKPIFGKILPAPSARAEKVANTPGPGHYEAKKLTPQTCSSSFVSTAARGTAKVIKEKSQMPGPGSYEPLAANRQDLREVYPDLQYFGSTVERFKDGPSGKAPGPGTYDERKRESAKSSWVKSNRFALDGTKQAATMPGPGQYNPGALEGKTSGPLGTVSILGSTGCLAFGSMESKRGMALKSDAPGPGAYGQTTPSEEPASSSGAGRPGRRMPKPARSQSAVFRSETPASFATHLAIKEGLQRPPPGAYTPTLARDTGTVMRQPPKAEGFLSAAPRDKTSDPTSKQSAAPGPGRYDTVIDVSGGKKSGTFNRTIVEGAPSGGRPKGLGFESQARRFRMPSSKDTPGPGSYNVEPHWVSKTHNIHFGDVG